MFPGDFVGCAIRATQRQSDGIDPEHGFRAAAWIGQRGEVLPAALPRGRVVHLCGGHVQPDRQD
jgi:hypothetical protein